MVEDKAQKEAEMRRLAEAVEVMQDALMSVRSHFATELPGEKFEEGGDNQTYLTFSRKSEESYERIEFKIYIRSSLWHNIYDRCASFEVRKTYGRAQTILYKDSKKAVAKFKEYVDGLKGFDANKVESRNAEKSAEEAKDALVRVRNREVDKIGLTPTDALTPCFTPNDDGTWLFRITFTTYSAHSSHPRHTYFPENGKLLTTEQARQLVALLT